MLFSSTSVKSAPCHGVAEGEDESLNERCAWGAFHLKSASLEVNSLKASSPKGTLLEAEGRSLKPVGLLFKSRRDAPQVPGGNAP